MNVTEILPKVDDFLQRKHGCFIDGAWVVPEGARTELRDFEGSRSGIILR